MLKVLKALLGKISRERSPKNPALGARPQPSNASGDYRGVALVPGMESCAAAKEALDKRFLMRQAPRLPLAKCTMPANCSCKFHKDADRRDGDRRLLGETATNLRFVDNERREGGRRKSKKR